MIPSNNDMQIDKENFMNIFLDNGTNQLEDNFLLSKKKYLNAQKGKNEMFEMLKMKLKGLDMQLAIMQNNKELLKGEDLLCVEPLLSLLTIAKSDKVLFPPIFKKIKTLTSLLIKNQTNVKNEANYASLIKFVVYILNLGYEHSTFQQLTDLIAVDSDMLKVFINELFQKLFTGRNVNMKSKDVKFIIRFLMIKYITPAEMIKNLLSFLRSKVNGGSRTTHQANMVMIMLGYVGELIVSKGDQLELKEKSIGKVLDNIKEIINEKLIKEDAEAEEDEEKPPVEGDGEAKLKKKQMFANEIVKLTMKLIGAFSKCKVNMEGKDIFSKKSELDFLLSDITKKYNLTITKEKRKESIDNSKVLPVTSDNKLNSNSKVNTKQRTKSE